MTPSTARGVARPSRETLLYAGLLLNTELALLFGYVFLTEGSLGAPRYALYGMLWVNVGVWALWRTRVPPASRRTKRRAAAVAGAYFAALAVAGGLVTGAPPGTPVGFRIAWLPPGWGPAPVYAGSTVNVVLMPARVVGYAALAYLVYATVVDVAGILPAGGGSESRTAAGAAVSGLFGLLSCVSCSWPILASLATGAFGGGSAVAAAAFGLSYDLSTVVFLVTVALLSWRPFASGPG